MTIRASVKMLKWLLDSVDLANRCFETANAFLESQDIHQSGCLLLDVRMPGMSGLELQDVMRAKESPISVVFLTGHGDIPMATAAMARGAFDFIEKPFNNQRLLGNHVNRAMARSAELVAQNGTSGVWRASVSDH